MSFSEHPAVRKNAWWSGITAHAYRRRILYRRAVGLCAATPVAVLHGKSCSTSPGLSATVLVSAGRADTGFITLPDSTPQQLACFPKIFEYFAVCGPAASVTRHLGWRPCQVPLPFLSVSRGSRIMKEFPDQGGKVLRLVECGHMPGIRDGFQSSSGCRSGSLHFSSAHQFIVLAD